MNLTDGRTTSIWPTGASIPSFSPLTSDRQADVCIVGGGIAGLSAAYLLQRQGKSIILVNDRPLGDGQTGRTSAHLASAIDDRFYELHRTLGEDAARLAYQSHAAAIDQIESIARQEQIDCDFLRVDGYLFLAEADDQRLLDRELDATKLIGFDGVEKLSRAPLDAFDTGPCLRFPRQAVFHPLKYLAGLARCIVRDGGQIFCGSRIVDVQGSNSSAEPCSARTEAGAMATAGAVVVATNTPAPINWVSIHTKQAPYRTYLIGARIPRSAVPNALFWDSGDPYHYIRIESSTDPAHDILLVGGEDHKVGQLPDNAAPFLNLERWARQRFPMIIDIPFHWSGQVQEPVDGVAYIGLAPLDKGNVYVATGDSGMGLTHGTIAGILITDLITGKPNAWADLYSPARKPTAAVSEYVSENVNAAKHFMEYLTPGEVKTEQDLAPGTGAVIREGLKKLAIYRDDAGQFHRVSAVCTHMQCLVHWNQTERTWDCPCHGSRFDPNGKVVTGPAISDLPPANPQ